MGFHQSPKNGESNERVYSTGQFTSDNGLGGFNFSVAQ